MAGMGTPLPAFLGMWTAMMAAMMLPAVAPVAVLWSRAIAARVSGLVRVWRLGQFVAGYLGAWSAAGLVAYGLVVFMESGPAAAPGPRRALR